MAIQIPLFKQTHGENFLKSRRYYSATPTRLKRNGWKSQGERYKQCGELTMGKTGATMR